eukprot:CAMPEP_0194269280 /NCGR_PEP_ID=MMETSP0169-20130528/3466_1 /TAXON_ID=218684 /ORGANISM="Corethron pennatum, Strain L29A3" /LENGTH=330 /DNA_ID=CAMNT_0039010865 /DNA_START=172 /DNA_END=1164 /DNA_ORIENTATION=-
MEASESGGHAHDLITGAFGNGADLYAILGLETGDDRSVIKQGEIKKAYHKTALRYHPDKQRGNKNDIATATSKFQAVTAAFQILSDPDRRADYDATGSYDDGNGESGEGVSDWLKYFRQVFRRVEKEDIDAFEEKYRGGDEERIDVLKYYVTCKGNLNRMLECVMLSREDDKVRWSADYIEPAIEAREVMRYGDLKKTLVGAAVGMSDGDSIGSDEEGRKGKRRVRRKKDSVRSDMSKRDKMEHRAAKKRKEVGASDDLVAAILARNGSKKAQESRDSSFQTMISGIEDRYARGGKKTGKKKKGTQPPPDIDDEEFERLRAEMDARRRKR